MHKLTDALGIVRLHLEASAPVQDAMNDLMKHASRMAEALRFYASKNNYIDGVPLHPDKQGFLTNVDEGQMARYALGLEDYPLGTVLRLPPAQEATQ